MSSGDLTRWNRAGLKRFRYVDGNAVTYLERLRAALADKFTAEGETLPKWSDLVTRNPVKDAETQAEREVRLIVQYEDGRRDHTWEILRSFARSTHVLTEHLDAFANETFIGTATQWDSVRRLVQLLDARPSPPASARTDLAFDAKSAGELARGVQVKNAPKDGGAPAIFETVEDLPVDPDLNLLHPTDWDRSQVDFTYQSGAGGHFASFPLADPGTAPTVGEIAVLEIAAETEGAMPTAYGVQIQPGTPGNTLLQGQATSDGSDLTVKRWRVALFGAADLVQLPRLAGPDVVILTAQHNLAAGRSTVTWADGGTWRTAKVMEVDGNRVRLDADPMPDAGDDLYLMTTAKSQVLEGGETLIVPVERGAGGRVWSPSLNEATVLDRLGLEGTADEYLEYQYVAFEAVVLYVPGGSDPVARVEISGPEGLVLGGTVEGVRQGDWIVSAGSDLQAVRVEAVTEREGDTAIDTSPAIADLQAPVHLKFSETYRPFDYDRNRTLAFDDEARSDHVTRLFVAPTSWPDALKRGRAVIVETEGLVHSAEITAAESESGYIEVKPPVPGTELTEPQSAPPLERWSTVVSANVVTADHGETQPLKIMGSGDATQSNQSFEVKAQELSFVTDPLMPSGVRAAIEVFVGGQRWRQVANLRDSTPTGSDYEVRVAEDGTVTVHFGDGRNGRRLPTGTDNLRVTWRKGVGPSGNVTAGGLVKIVQPNPLIDKVRQPGDAAGGAGTEGVASLRENAAAGLLTLGRAVSVSDYGKLATQNAQVLQAVSYQQGPGGGRGERVAVAVVPAGGRMGTLADDLTDFLDSHGLPGVTVDVAAYVALPLGLKIALKVKTDEFDPEKVAAEVEAAIVAAHAIDRARLGAPLYRSQILNTVESVAGVENATAEILTDDWAGIAPAPLVIRSPGLAVRAVKPRKNQMIHHDPDLSAITISTEEFSM